jgi:hypothetical protein
MINAQSVPKIERVEISAPIFTVKVSLFLSGLDSLIFNSVCPEIKEMNELKIFNVYSRKNNQQENSYRLIISLNKIVQIHNENDFKGCFDYKGYTFLWFYDVPQQLFSLSNQKKKLTYMKNAVHIVSSHAEFVFDYTEGILTLTGICCF